VLGAPPVHPFTIAIHLVIPSAISHWSALHHQGFTEQVPRVVTAITPKKVVTPSMRGASERVRRQKHAWIVDGVRYEFVTVREAHFFGFEEIWIDEYTKIPITDKERTVLDTFISPRMFGGMGEGLGIIEEHLPMLTLDRLVNYTCRYGKISVAKRLGWALERAGIEESALTPLLEMPVTGYHALDPTRPRRGPCDRRWMIQNNLQEESAR
jgi:predicted transcriptional regulator of viral defense system